MDITIGIKTFLRPECLSKCLNSIKQYYNNVKIIVADDSPENIKRKNKRICRRSKMIQYLNLPFDTGLAEGRNKILQSIKTKYFLILDDDMILTDKTDLEKGVKFLDETGMDILGGSIKGRSSNEKIYHKVIEKNNTYTVVYEKGNGYKIQNKQLEAYKVNFIYNIFFGRVSEVLKNPWEKKNKCGEHNLFFIKWFMMGKDCAYSPDLVFDEDHLENPLYLHYRSRSPSYQTGLHFITQKEYSEIKFEDIPNVIHFIIDKTMTYFNVIAILTAYKVYSTDIYLYTLDSLEDNKNTELVLDYSKIIKFQDIADVYKSISTLGGLLLDIDVISIKNLMPLSCEWYCPELALMIRANSNIDMVIDFHNNKKISIKEISRDRLDPISETNLKLFFRKPINSIFVTIFSNYSLYMHDFWKKKKMVMFNKTFITGFNCTFSLFIGFLLFLYLNLFHII